MESPLSDNFAVFRVRHSQPVDGIAGQFGLRVSYLNCRNFLHDQNCPESREEKIDQESDNGPRHRDMIASIFDRCLGLGMNLGRIA